MAKSIMQSPDIIATEAKKALMSCLCTAIHTALVETDGENWFEQFRIQDLKKEKKILQSSKQTSVEHFDFQAILKFLRYYSNYSQKVFSYYHYYSDDTYIKEQQESDLMNLLTRLINIYRNRMDAHLSKGEVQRLESGEKYDELYGYRDALRDMEKLSGIFKDVLDINGVSYYERIKKISQKYDKAIVSTLYPIDQTIEKENLSISRAQFLSCCADHNISVQTVDGVICFYTDDYANVLETVKKQFPAQLPPPRAKTISKKAVGIGAAILFVLACLVFFVILPKIRGAGDKSNSNVQAGSPQETPVSTTSAPSTTKTQLEMTQIRADQIATNWMQTVILTAENGNYQAFIELYDQKALSESVIRGDFELLAQGNFQKEYASVDATALYYSQDVILARYFFYSDSGSGNSEFTQATYVLKFSDNHWKATSENGPEGIAAYEKYRGNLRKRFGEDYFYEGFITGQYEVVANKAVRSGANTELVKAKANEDGSVSLQFAILNGNNYTIFKMYYSEFFVLCGSGENTEQVANITRLIDLQGQSMRPGELIYVDVVIPKDRLLIPAKDIDFSYMGTDCSFHNSY